MDLDIKSLDELQIAAQSFVDILQEHRVIALEGEMGAGKTTFVNLLLKELGVEKPEGSPTYSLVNVYDTNFGKVYHFDVYRLKNEFEALDSGMEEMLDSDAICFVEWPQKIVNLLPDKTLWVNIRRNVDDSRTISIQHDH